MCAPALAGDLTSVRYKGQWLPLGVRVDDLSGQVLTIDALCGEDAANLQAWMAPIAEQVGARLLITDAAERFKQVAAALGLPQQVCKAHVVRTTEALIETLAPLAVQDRDGSLAALGVAPTQRWSRPGVAPALSKGPRRSMLCSLHSLP